MNIGILRIGEIDASIVERIQENLSPVFSKATCTLIDETLSPAKQAYDKTRKQYRSDMILNIIREYTGRQRMTDRVLGILDIDIFVPPMNFVFGQADSPGKAALISLHRLRQEFHRRKPDPELLIERGTKEAVHELGHTMGLSHCSNPFCVMYFSNSIFETDRKQSLFCTKCYVKVETTLNESSEKT